MRTYNIETITPEDVRDLLLAGDDSVDNQVRVKRDGTVYLSQVTGSQGTDGVAILFETFIAGNGYVGPADDGYAFEAPRLHAAMKEWWEGYRDNPEARTVYLDSW